MLAANTASDPPRLSVGTTGGMNGSISGSVFASPASASTGPGDCQDHAHVMQEQIRIQLIDANGAVVGESLTDEQGTYRFADLLPGEYSVRRVVLDASSSAEDSAANQQELSGISLQGGEELAAYDFCIVETSNLGLTAEEFDRLASVLAVASAPARETALALQAETVFVGVNANNDLELLQIQSSRQADFYGGSSQIKKSAKSIKTWDGVPLDGSPLDDFFSTISFLELSSVETAGVASLEQLLGDAQESELAFVDGYTLRAVEAWDLDAELDLREVLGPEATIAPDADHASVRTPDVPIIAARSDVQPTR